MCVVEICHCHVCHVPQKVVTELIQSLNPSKASCQSQVRLCSCNRQMLQIMRHDTSKALSDSGEVNKGKAQHFPVWSKLATP